MPHSPQWRYSDAKVELFPLRSLEGPCIQVLVVVDGTNWAQGTAGSWLQRTRLRPTAVTHPPRGWSAAEPGLMGAHPAPLPDCEALVLLRNRNETHSAFAPSLLPSLSVFLFSVFLKAFVAGLSWWEKRFFPEMDRCSMCQAVWADTADLY